jgi:hypothetical protein
MYFKIIIIAVSLLLMAFCFGNTNVAEQRFGNTYIRRCYWEAGHDSAAATLVEAGCIRSVIVSLGIGRALEPEMHTLLLCQAKAPHHFSTSTSSTTRTKVEVRSTKYPAHDCAMRALQAEPRPLGLSTARFVWRVEPAYVLFSWREGRKHQAHSSLCLC